MKRKLALLLAVIMTLALLPTSTLFASSDNKLTGLTATVSAKTVLVESNLLPNYSSGAAGPTTLGASPAVYVHGNLSNAVLRISGNEDVSYVQGAPYFRIEPNSKIDAGSTIELTLDGAEWFLADATNNSSKWNKGSVDISSMQQLRIVDPSVFTSAGFTGVNTLYDLYRLFVDGRVSDYLPSSYYGSTNNSADKFNSFNRFGGFGGFDTEDEILNSVTSGSGITLNPKTIAEQLVGASNAVEFLDSFRELSRRRSSGKTATTTYAGANPANQTAAPGESPSKFNKALGLQVIGSSYDAFNLTTTYRERLYSDETTFGGGTGTGASSTANGTASLGQGRKVAGFDGTTYTRYAAGNEYGVAGGDIIYTMTLSADKTKAYVKFPETIRADVENSDYIDPFADSLDGEDYIYIPIIARTTAAEGDVTLTVNGNNTSISGGTYVLGGSTSGGTYAYVNDPKTARDEFPIDLLLVKENRAGTMSSGRFEIAAPSGYSFNQYAARDLAITAENFGYTNANGLVVSQPLTRGTDFNAYFKDTRGEDDESVIVVELRTLHNNRSNVTGIPGTLVLKDGSVSDDHANHLMLISDDSSAFDTDVNLTIRPVSSDIGDTNITRQTDVKAGTRKDWTISLTTTGDIPTLINGRYYADDAEEASDEDHLAATVVFKENVEEAWWSGRVTNFTLPEGVKFRKVEIHDTDNLQPDYEDALENYFYNTNKRVNNVSVNENEINITGVQIQDNEKATLQLDLWLSVESGFEGDITLTASGSAIPEEVQPVVIAKAINPITVKAEVTPVRIGYQYFEVGNITIQENVAGALEKNKQVWISVTDRINTDMYFTPGYAVEVTEGNISVKDKGIAGGSSITVTNSKTLYQDYLVGGGTISLDVDGASSTASTIVLSNLQLKIDRTVPESTAGYDVYVWGPNVAPNSDVFDYSDVIANGTNGDGIARESYVNNDLHRELGIHTKYVEVATPATGVEGASALSAVVKVTAGSGTAYRNGEQITIDPSPFIDANSRTQVPVRALANLLGVTSEEIIWSNSDRTVTINLKDRVIQFAIGSDIMLVNGAQVRMDTTATIAPENERTFVPFRALGEALGVMVSWDDSTKTATYNADKE